MRKIVIRKFLLFTMVLATALILQASLPAFAAEPAPGVLILKVDRENVFQMPKDFRKAGDAFKKSPEKGPLPSRAGLDALNLSGSSFFSQWEFARMLTNLPADRLVILDLRSESHGYLNGMGVSWYSAYKRANAGKSAVEVDKIEKKLLAGTLNGPVKIAKLDAVFNIG